MEPVLLLGASDDDDINYTTEESGLATEYLKHPGANEQSLFHTIRGMKKYDPKYEVIRQYQEKYIDKMLSYSLKYGNILYCMNKEGETYVVYFPKGGQVICDQTTISSMLTGL